MIRHHSPQAPEGSSRPLPGNQPASDVLTVEFLKIYASLPVMWVNVNNRTGRKSMVVTILGVKYNVTFNQDEQETPIDLSFTPLVEV